MSVRRPVVLNSQGQQEELPEGEAIAGLTLHLPAFNLAGMLKLALRTDYALPVIQAGGSTLYIQVVI